MTRDAREPQDRELPARSFAGIILTGVFCGFLLPLITALVLGDFGYVPVFMLIALVPGGLSGIAAALAANTGFRAREAENSFVPVAFACLAFGLCWAIFIVAMYATATVGVCLGTGLGLAGALGISALIVNASRVQPTSQ